MLTLGSDLRYLHLHSKSLKYPEIGEALLACFLKLSLSELPSLVMPTPEYFNVITCSIIFPFSSNLQRHGFLFATIRFVLSVKIVMLHFRVAILNL